MKQLKRNLVPLLLIVGILISFFTILYIDKNYTLNNSLVATDDIIPFHTGWEFTDEHTLTNILPEKLPQNAALFIPTNRQNLKVYIGDELLYEYSPEQYTPFHSFLGQAWNIVDLPQNITSRQITLVITSSYNILPDVSSISLGEKTSIFLSLLQRNISVFFFCIVAGLAGILFIIIALWMYHKKTHLNQKSFLFMGIFLLFCSLWIFTDSNLPQFFFSNTVWVYYLSFFTFILMPIPLLIYIQEVCTHGCKFFNTMCYIFFLLFIINLTLFATDILPLEGSLPLVHAAIIVSIIGILYYIILERFRYHNPAITSLLYGLCILGAVAVLCIILMAVNIDYLYAAFFRGGIFLFLLILCQDILKKYNELIQSQIQSETYKKLAFTDILTGLNNRAAYERDLAFYNESLTYSLPFTVIVLDINNLKYCNDTFGHECGDQLIIAASKCLDSVFHKIGKCYRIGGDEFVILIKNYSESEIRKYLCKLDKLTQNYDTVQELSIAYGYETIDTFSNQNTIQNIFKAADNKMYRSKRAFHLAQGSHDYPKTL
jgi:diguanylate cyclase